jgi:carbonic anhydrase
MNFGRALGGFYMLGKISASVTAGLLATTLFAGGVAAQDNWSYSGNNGPASWHQLSPGYAQCRTGRSQSPIAIDGTDPVIMHRLVTDYRVSPLDLKNNHHSVSMKYASGSRLIVGAKRFNLLDFSFHSPGEHTVAGEQFPMSIQFKHRAADGSMAIVATLVREGAANLAAQEIWDNMPLEAGQAMKSAKVLVNARDLMPTDKGYYRYMGSLTTPPCSEGVHWYVLKKPLELSKAQIDLLRGVVGGDSARPLQPRNNRMILDARPQ